MPTRQEPKISVMVHRVTSETFKSEKNHDSLPFGKPYTAPLHHVLQLTLRSISGWSRAAGSRGSFTVSSLKRRSKSEVCLVLVAASVGDGAAGSCPAPAQTSFVKE